MNKRSRILLVAVMAAIVLAGCGKEKKEEKKDTNGFSYTTPTPTEAVTNGERTATPSPTPTPRDLKGLNFIVADWWAADDWDDPKNNMDMAEWLLEMEEKEKTCHFSVSRRNPKWEYGTEYTTKVSETIRDNTPVGSVISVDLKNVGKLLRDGCLTDLSKVTTVDWNDEKWNWNNILTKMFHINGGQYGIGWEENVPGLGILFNKKVFNELGVNPQLLYDLQKSTGTSPEYNLLHEDLTWSWSRFTELCGQLLKDTDGDGRIDVWPLLAEERFMVYGALLSNGTFVIEQDENGLLRVNTDDPAVTEALTFAGELMRKGYLVTAEEDDITPFLEGKCAMVIVEGTNFPYNTLADLEIDYGFATLPYGPSVGQPVSAVINDTLYFIPDCDSARDRLDDIAFACDCYFDHAHCICGDAYVEHDGWSRKYDWRFVDDNSLETVRNLIFECPKYTNATNLLADFRDDWVTEVLSGRDINQVLASHEDEWQKQVDEFNMLFD